MYCCTKCVLHSVGTTSESAVYQLAISAKGGRRREYMGDGKASATAAVIFVKVATVLGCC